MVKVVSRPNPVSDHTPIMWMPKVKNEWPHILPTNGPNMVSGERFLCESGAMVERLTRICVSNGTYDNHVDSTWSMSGTKSKQTR